MLEKNADVNCCFLCSVIFIEYYSTMHCNEVLQACRVDPIYCDIFGPAERVPIYGQPINLRYIHKRVPALICSCSESDRGTSLSGTSLCRGHCTSSVCLVVAQSFLSLSFSSEHLMCKFLVHMQCLGQGCGRKL